MNILKNDCKISALPVLKWAGGKGQIIQELIQRMPQKFNQYIEPFCGGAALFFALGYNNSIIADSNKELINLYNQIANNVDEVIWHLGKYKNTEEIYYKVRAQGDWELLPKAIAAARMIYLNHTCFNGLYRVNKTGFFNVPFGKYKNPTICDSVALHKASEILKKSKIIYGDYLTTLKNFAKPKDFIFIDPPYIPVSIYSNFKRYTKEQFYEEDHLRLANEIFRLHNLGCYIILTNSNHPLVHRLYKNFKIEIIQTKRSISCNSSKRKGEDLIITIFPKEK